MMALAEVVWLPEDLVSFVKRKFERFPNGEILANLTRIHSGELVAMFVANAVEIFCQPETQKCIRDFLRNLNRGREARFQVSVESASDPLPASIRIAIPSHGHWTCKIFYYYYHNSVSAVPTPDGPTLEKAEFANARPDPFSQ